jgi:hypothetical protein
MGSCDVKRPSPCNPATYLTLTMEEIGRVGRPATRRMRQMSRQQDHEAQAGAREIPPDHECRPPATATTATPT